MPTEHTAVNTGESLSLIDKSGIICGALSNLSDSVVPLEEKSTDGGFSRYPILSLNQEKEDN